MTRDNPPVVSPPQETDRDRMAAVFAAWLSRALLSRPPEDDLVIEVEDPGPPDDGVQIIVKTCRNCHRPYTHTAWEALPFLRWERLPARGLGLEWRRCYCDTELALSTGTAVDHR